MTDMLETIAKHVFEAMRFERSDETPDWVDGGNSNAQVEARRVTRNIIDTIPQVKVKPLVWEEFNGGFNADSVVGKYRITLRYGLIAGWGLTERLKNKNLGIFKDKEAAVSAAQAHHDAAILSAIDQAPQTDHDRAVIEAAQVWRESLEVIELDEVQSEVNLLEANRARNEALSAIEGEG